jgi:hypothetical protein
MKSGTANAWVTRYFDEHVHEPWLGHWQDFLDELHSSLEDKNLQRKAREKLESFRQGTHRIDEYFAIFDSLLNDVEVVSDDEKDGAHRLSLQQQRGTHHLYHVLRPSADGWEAVGAMC